MPQKLVPQVQREWSALIAPQVLPMPYPVACLIQSASRPIRAGTAEDKPYWIPSAIVPQPQRDPSERSARTPDVPQERPVQRTLLSAPEGARTEIEGDPPPTCAGAATVEEDKVEVEEEQETRKSAADAAAAARARRDGFTAVPPSCTLGAPQKGSQRFGGRRWRAACLAQAGP